jgi:hypothetical protein
MVQTLMKMADLGHLALPVEQHTAWAERLRAENFLQVRIHS